MTPGESRLLGKLVEGQEHFAGTVTRIEGKQDTIIDRISEVREDAARDRAESEAHKEHDDERFRAIHHRIDGSEKRFSGKATAGLVALGTGISGAIAAWLRGDAG